jgi:hypothetical protein
MSIDPRDRWTSWRTRVLLPAVRFHACATEAKRRRLWSASGKRCEYHVWFLAAWREQ